MNNDKDKIKKHGTLVITELSNLGIAMVADSAITIDGRPFVGYQKLFPVRQINAGISIWGNQDIRGTDADIFIRGFIKNEVPNGMSLREMADKLTKKLNNTFGDRLKRKNLEDKSKGLYGSCRMGLHIAGFDIKDGIRGPSLCAINNGDYKVGFYDGDMKEVSIDSTEDHIETNPPLREFRIDGDPNLQPKTYEMREFRRRKNGDFAIEDYLYQDFIHVFKSMQQYNFIFPHPSSLEIQGEYLRFWANLVKEIYRLSNKNETNLMGGRPPFMIDYMHIGGPVSVLTISETGINSFYTI